MSRYKRGRKIVRIVAFFFFSPLCLIVLFKLFTYPFLHFFFLANRLPVCLWKVTPHVYFYTFTLLRFLIARSSMCFCFSDGCGGSLSPYPVSTRRCSVCTPFKSLNPPFPCCSCHFGNWCFSPRCGLDAPHQEGLSITSRPSIELCHQSCTIAACRG